MKVRSLVGFALWLSATIAYSLLIDHSDVLRSFGLAVAGALIATGISLMFGTDFGSEE